MPKDEFDFEDPLELNGVALFTDEDTSGEMAACFIEEFMRMGYNHKQVLALFRNPHYIGPNQVLQSKGEPFVRDLIASTFLLWGRPCGRVEAPAKPAEGTPSGQDASVTPRAEVPPATDVPGTAADRFTDPMGSPVPKLKL
ncbi:MAG TPA: hypothetical protein VMS21_14960 [Methylomirabilota bacterium]|nr:hypothetical protein [Methylomirabilota bacterium]